MLQAPANLFALDFQVHAGTPSRVEIFQGSHRVPGHLTLDAHLRVALAQKLLLTIGTSNITGERYGWHASGPPSPARGSWRSRGGSGLCGSGAAYEDPSAMRLTVSAKGRYEYPNFWMALSLLSLQN